MRVDIITIFPGMFQGPFKESMLSRAVERGIVEIHIRDLRSFCRDKHLQVDDYPYGGGRGMVLKPEPLFNAVEKVKAESRKSSRVILLTPQGEVFSQEKARRLSRKEHLILICGHYEGVDERVRRALVDEEISIGDYVLTGGELPAMVLTDAVTRLLPGLLSEDALREESFEEGLLEYPQYTRPAEFKGMNVPEVLLSGDHGRIEKWRREMSLQNTQIKRPDLYRKYRERRKDSS